MQRGMLVSFLKFGGLSGLGWLGDFLIFISLVLLLAVPPFWANCISSTVAALVVFLVSLEWIFIKADVMRLRTLGSPQLASSIDLSTDVQYLE